MIERLFSHIAPHLCCGCGKVGTLLCGNCKYNIDSEIFSLCIACCGVNDDKGVCSSCDLPYERAWCVGERSGGLQRLIGDFKFQNVYDGHRPLAELLLSRLDDLPPETVVVPVPTVAAHIRQRGYDHMLLIARYVAKKRGLQLARPLRRAANTKQRDADMALRIQQAKTAFKITGKIDPSVPYLLIDDVVTTGATMQYGAQALKDAGAATVWVAAVARQPLD